MPPPWKMMNASGPEVATNGSGESDAPWQKSFQKAEERPSNGSHTSRGFGNFDSSNAGTGNQIKIMFWPATATEEDLRTLFSDAGEIKRARVLTPREGRDITLSFVTFGSDGEAQAAVSQFNGHEVEGRRIRVELDGADNKRQQERPQTGSLTSNQIKVFSWPASLTEDDMRTLFDAAGNIQRVKVLPAREDRDITLGFVTFSSNEEVARAIETFNEHEIEGKRLRVEDSEKGSGTRASSKPEEGGFSGGFNAGFNAERFQKGSRAEVQVRSCPASVSEDELKEVFSAAGTVKNVKILPPRDGMDITLAFVAYDLESEAASAAEKFDGFELMGKRLRVGLKENRSQNGSNGSQDSAKPWGRSGGSNETSQASNESGAKPWGQPTSKADAQSFRPSGFGTSRSEPKDDGIFIEDGEMNDGFAFKPARAPVIYIPPPPPENENGIFNDTCHQGINFEKYESIPFEVTGREPPKGINTFDESGLHQVCIDNLRRAKYKTPTPIQKSVLPAVCAGRDVMACAQTGSGKTAAYLLPVISNLMKNGVQEADTCESACPNVLIITPTRELAIQIFLEARKFAYGSRLRTVVIYGGVSVSHQLGTLSDGCNILVATPGRLNDFIERRRVSLSNIQFFILDEADRMLDMGFESTIRNIAGNSNLPGKEARQTLMLSATFPESIQLLAANYLNDYIFITVGRVGSASSDIAQSVVEIPGSEKRTKLEEILLESAGERILVFVETKRSADFLASFLSQRNFPATSISSDRSQEERECALRDFRTGKAPVLIATAVAARGLDIPNVKHVINFDLPSEIDEYIHRIGRTGRIGNQGRATAFFDRTKDQRLARGLVKVLSEARQEVPEWLEELAMSAVGTGFGPSGDQFSSRDRRKQNRDGFRMHTNSNGNSEGSVDRQPLRNGSSAGIKPTSSESKAEAEDDMWC
ncbi:probable ATP-dependent RNA helicase DDX4 [Rhopilema esculentum]|uniref:probable ATP-dependent RNA helicase DDX4 n=1 Tax=Rhopilema esculentum TaxID=499914 RepID=UPI0031DF3713